MVYSSKKEMRFIIPVLIFAVSLLSCKAQKVAVEQEKPKTKVEEKKPEPQKKDTITQKMPPQNGTYNFLLLLPVNLADAFVTDTLLPDSIMVKENFNKDLLDAVNFYEGALLAVDSLRKTGNDIKLKVVDLPEEDDRQKTKLWIQKYDNVHLVFSMVKGKPLKTLSEILTVKKIPLISCGANTYSFVEKNPYAVCVQPSSLTQCTMMGAFAAKRFRNDNFIMLVSGSDKEQERSAAFISAFDSVTVTRIKKINFSLEGAAAVTRLLSAAYTNTLFIPSTDEDFVTAVYSFLETYQGAYRFRVIGLPVWQYFETIDLRLLEKYNTLLFTPDYYSYDEPQTLQFRKKFRQHFSSEPADDAYLAYDSFLQFGYLFLNQHLPLDTAAIHFKGLRSSYHFQHNNLKAAENSYINVLKIENFSYVKLNEN